MFTSIHSGTNSFVLLFAALCCSNIVPGILTNKQVNSMLRSAFSILVSLAALTQVNAQTMVLSTSSDDYEVTPVFSDVGFFTIDVEIATALAPGVYVDPPIINVTYQVTGDLVDGTPSGFPAFDLQRNITGAEFYAQGSSLSFEIAQFAVLSDGIQAAELAGSGVVLTFNAREVDNGRFHPALFELSANGTGRIQNSDNVHTLDPLLQINFGDEYITDLGFDPGNTTLIIDPSPTPPKKRGGGSSSLLSCAILVLLGIYARTRNRRLSPARLRS